LRRRASRALRPPWPRSARPARRVTQKTLVSFPPGALAVSSQRPTSPAAKGGRLRAVVRQPRFRHRGRLAVHGWLGGDRVNTHRRGTASEVVETEILERKAIEIRKPLQRGARCEELAIKVAGGLLDA